MLTARAFKPTIVVKRSRLSLRWGAVRVEAVIDWIHVFIASVPGRGDLPGGPAVCGSGFPDSIY